MLVTCGLECDRLADLRMYRLDTGLSVVSGEGSGGKGMRTFGIEEEFIFLKPATLQPANVGDEVHVHVGIPSRDAGVQALNRVRVWLPTLRALAVNSPFWHGADTGFSSWRSVHMRRWSTIGTLESALIVTDELLRYAGDAIDEVGNRERIVGLLARARRLGTGAERQRAAMRSGGQPALAALLTQALTAHD
ncbi:hypothetical protein E3T35_05385 [Cryobacterium sp. TMT1-2-2]|nr:hypothetical protein E3T35_05385 [Cryobacterium sp. TMT1-2-2]